MKSLLVILTAFVKKHTLNSILIVFKVVTLHILFTWNDNGVKTILFKQNLHKCTKEMFYLFIFFKHTHLCN